MTYKPDKYPDLSPYLVVKDAELTLEFCKEVLGATEKRVNRRDDGSIEHGEVLIGDSILMFGQKENGGDALIHLYHPHPDVLFQRAIEFGASALQPVADQVDGDRRGGVRDRNGTCWFFASQSA